MHFSLTTGLSLSSLNPGAIGCLLKLHSPQGLLIVHVIVSGGLEIRLFTQVDPDILEYLGKEAAVESTRVVLSTQDIICIIIRYPT